MSDVSYVANFSSLPPKIHRELSVICAVMLQLDQMDDEGRKRVIAYIANAYPNS